MSRSSAEIREKEGRACGQIERKKGASSWDSASARLLSTPDSEVA